MSNTKRAKLTESELERLRRDWDQAGFIASLVASGVTKATPCEDGTQAGTDDDRAS